MVPLNTETGGVKEKVKVPLVPIVIPVPLWVNPGANVFSRKQSVSAGERAPLYCAVTGIDRATIFCAALVASSVNIANTTCWDPAGTDGAAQNESAAVFGADCAAAMPPLNKNSTVASADALYIAFFIGSFLLLC